MESYHATNEHLDSEVIAWSAAYAVVGTMVVAINTFTLWIFIRTPSLRTRKHVMLINLAVADLLFGAIGLPFSVVFLLKPTIGYYYTQQTLNSFFKTASLFTVGVIALERMHAIIWPLRHRVLKNRVYEIALAVIWVLSAVLTTILMLYQSGLLDISSYFDLSFPLVITIVTFTIVACYVSIWISFRRRKHRNRGTVAKQDKALAVTLLLVAGVFLICWGIPLFYLSISRPKICQNCYQPTTTVFRGARLIFALPSIINPVIYCFRLSEFKASLKVRVYDVRCSGDLGSRHVHARQRQSSREIEMANVSSNKVSEWSGGNVNLQASSNGACLLSC